MITLNASTASTVSGCRQVLLVEKIHSGDIRGSGEAEQHPDDKRVPRRALAQETAPPRRLLVLSARPSALAPGAPTLVVAGPDDDDHQQQEHAEPDIQRRVDAVLRRARRSSSSATRRRAPDRRSRSSPSLRPDSPTAGASVSPAPASASRQPAARGSVQPSGRRQRLDPPAAPPRWPNFLNRFCRRKAAVRRADHHRTFRNDTDVG